MSTHQSLYVRYKDLILLFIGFILTGILGTYITSQYQIKQQSSAMQMEQLRQERQEATTAASEISELIGKHHFNALQLRGAIDEYILHPSAENLTFMNEQSTLYRGSVRDWNTQWNKNRTKLRMLFGTEFEAKFYVHSDISQERYAHSLTGLFNNMHNELVAAKAVALSKYPKKSFDFSRFDTYYNAIGYLSYELYNSMIEQIQKGEIGSFNKKPVENLAPTYAFPSGS